MSAVCLKYKRKNKVVKEKAKGDSSFLDKVSKRKSF